MSTFFRRIFFPHRYYLFLNDKNSGQITDWSAYVENSPSYFRGKFKL